MPDPSKLWQPILAVMVGFQMVWRVAGQVSKIVSLKNMEPEEDKVGFSPTKSIILLFCCPGSSIPTLGRPRRHALTATLEFGFND